MSNPNLNTDTGFDPSLSCSACPAGRQVSAATLKENDETSCQLCPSGTSSDGSLGATCSLACSPLPDNIGSENGYILRNIVENALGLNGEAKKITAITKYGNMENWDVSAVTNMDFLFNSISSFNLDVSKWITSNVTQMDNLFFGASAFNQDVSKWDTSNVVNMNQLFDGASAFNQDGKWL